MNEAAHELEALLAEYIDGTIDPSNRAKVEALLNRDSELRVRVAEMIADAEALRRVSAVPIPVDLSEQFTSRFERDLLLDGPTKPSVSRRFRLPPVAIAALLLVGTGVTLLAIKSVNSPPADTLAMSDQPESPATDVVMGRAERDDTIEPAATPAPAVAASRSAPAAMMSAPAVSELLLSNRPIDEPVWDRIEAVRIAENSKSPVVALMVDAAPETADFVVNSFFIDQNIRHRRIELAESARSAGVAMNEAVGESALVAHEVTIEQVNELSKSLAKSPGEPVPQVFLVAQSLPQMAVMDSPGEWAMQQKATTAETVDETLASNQAVRVQVEQQAGAVNQDERVVGEDGMLRLGEGITVPAGGRSLAEVERSLTDAIEAFTGIRPRVQIAPVLPAVSEVLVKPDQKVDLVVVLRNRPSKRQVQSVIDGHSTQPAQPAEQTVPGDDQRLR